MADSNGRRVFDLVLRVTTMPHVDPSLSVAERIDAACDRFEAEWKAGNRPRIEDYLAAVPESDREPLREALVGIELELPGRSAAETSGTQSSVRSHNKVAPVMTVDHVLGAPESSEVVGRFEIRGVLGSGAFGKVYRAFDPQLGREVALKVPLESAVKSDAERSQFLKEARAAATINHPNVCQIHEVGEHAGRPYIVMALVPGQSLAEVLKAQKEPMTEKQSVLIVRKVAQALAAAHGKGIVHRDLKPANIMFDRERKDIVVMDFGLARGPKVADARATQSGVIMGTPAYMSPEQARGESKAVSPAGDVFSLGVILYELLTGTRPFAGTATEVIGQILHVDPEPPSKRRPSIDPRLEAICLKAMAKDPAARFATMSEFAVAMDAILRAPKPTGPAAETAKAQETRQNTEPAGTETLGEVFAALSADRKQARAETAAAVEAAIARHRTPRWVFVLAGLLLVGGLTALGSIIFFTRSDKVSVTIELTDVDLADKTLSFFLDEEPISAEALAKPIELKPGEHVLVVKRGKEIVKRVLLTVAGGRSPGLRYKDITPPPAETKPSPEAEDRRVAELVLGLGGEVQIEVADKRMAVKSSRELPAADFALVSVSLANNDRVRDDALVALAGSKKLEGLNLNGTPITSRGLAHLRSLTVLKYLNLCVPALRDADLAVIKTLPRLYSLEISYTPIGDAGLKHLAECASLRTLYVVDTKVTDGGVAMLKAALPRCEVVRKATAGLDERKTAADVERALTIVRQLGGKIEEDPNRPGKPVVGIDLEGKPLSDAGLAGLSGLAEVKRLKLNGTKLTDAGLEHLSAFRKLESLSLPGGAATNQGLARLAGLTTLKELGIGAFAPMTDAGLAHLKGLSKLEELNVSYIGITDEGLKHLQGLSNMKNLCLNATKVTDAGMVHLKGMKNLHTLWVGGTKVTEAGTKELQRTLPNLATVMR